MKALTIVVAMLGAIGFASVAAAGPGCDGHEVTAEKPKPPKTS